MTKELEQTTSEQPKKSRVLNRENKAVVSEKTAKVTRQIDSPEEIQEEQIPPSGRVRIRLIPIWLRVIIVIILIALAIVLGAMFGYAVIGEGKATDVFKKETWQHIFDIMNGVQ